MGSMGSMINVDVGTSCALETPTSVKNVCRRRHVVRIEPASRMSVDVGVDILRGVRAVSVAIDQRFKNCHIFTRNMM